MFSSIETRIIQGDVTALRMIDQSIYDNIYKHLYKLYLDESYELIDIYRVQEFIKTEFNSYDMILKILLFKHRQMDIVDIVIETNSNNSSVILKDNNLPISVRDYIDLKKKEIKMNDKQLETLSWKLFMIIKTFKYISIQDAQVQL